MRFAKTNLGKYFFPPVIHFGRYLERVGRVVRRVPGTFREFVLREISDGVVSEDEVSRPVLSDELEEGLDVCGGGQDVSPRKASCLDNVLGGLASVKNLTVVFARGFFVRLDIVLVLFRPVTLSDVMSNADEIGGSVAYGFNVGVEAVEVEDVEGSLESVVEADDDVEVSVSILMVFLTTLHPVRC